jgi:uncharacterized protein (DUF2062 family)
MGKLILMELKKLGPHRHITAIFGLSTLFSAGPAAAYLGPGAGLGMIGSLIAVIIVALVVILGLVIYPVRMLRKRRRKATAANSESKSAD